MRTHGMEGTRLYGIWGHMKNRCQSLNSDAYSNYGSRGITVCNEWQQFVPFMEWALANGYQDNLTIERKNNNGNYEPDNCIWATRSVQNANTRKNTIITVNGINDTFRGWSERTGVHKKTLGERYRMGLRGEELIRPTHTRIKKG